MVPRGGRGLGHLPRPCRASLLPNAADSPIAPPPSPPPLAPPQAPNTPGLSPRSVPPRRTALLTKEYNAFYSHAAVSQSTNTRPATRRNDPPRRPAPRPPAPPPLCVQPPFPHPSKDTVTPFSPLPAPQSTLLSPKSTARPPPPPRTRAQPSAAPPLPSMDDGCPPGDGFPWYANVLQAESAPPLRALRGATYLWLHPSAPTMPLSQALGKAPPPNGGRSPSEGTAATRG